VVRTARIGPDFVRVMLAGESVAGFPLHGFDQRGYDIPDGMDAVRTTPLPEGRLAAYLVGEQALPAALRRWLVGEHGIPTAISFTGYRRLKHHAWAHPLESCEMC
jgi:NADPH-dependent ferric siderophore reductase